MVDWKVRETNREDAKDAKAKGEAGGSVDNRSLKKVKLSKVIESEKKSWLSSIDL